MRKAVLWGVWTLLVSVTLAAPRVSQAQQGDVAAAAASFSRAQEAEARGDHARAATLFELADRISPAPASLRNATRARMAAGQLAVAAGNAEELKRRYPDDKASAAVAEEVLAEARQKLARVAAECSKECHLVVDGLAVSAELRKSHVVFVDPGAHTLVARFEDGNSSSERIQGTAGQQLQLSFSAPSGSGGAAPGSAAQPAPATASGPGALPGATSSPPEMEKSHGWSPAVGVTLGAMALVVGGVAAWSAIDTQSAREDFETNPTREGFDDGEGKDLRTNVLIGAAAVVGLISVSVLAFGTDWGSSAQAEKRHGVALTLGGSTQGARVGVRGSF